MWSLPSALFKITKLLFMNDCCPLVSRTLPVPLSLKRTLVGGRRFQPSVCCRERASFWAQFFWTTEILHLVQQPSELSIEERTLLSGAGKFPSCRCCSISVLVPASFFVVVDYNQFYTARKSSTNPEKHRDLVKTRGFTYGDNVTHFCDSFQCGRMQRTVAHSFFLVSSISVHGSGRVDFVHLCTLSFV